MESFNGLTSRIVDQSDFGGIWESSLTDSASKGLPDTELVTYDSRLHTIREIRMNSDKPIVVDWDTGGQITHFPHWVSELEKAGVDAIVIEDKAFPKKNSLMAGAKHILEDVDSFSAKIKAGKEVAKDIIIIARLESLIAQHSMFEALVRAEAYINAGADGIMIHSKSDVSGSEVMQFAERFKKQFPDVLLMCVPTTYNNVKDTILEEAGFNIICHANHLLRASITAMQDTIKTILKNDCSKGLKIAKVTDIFELTGDKDKTK